LVLDVRLQRGRVDVDIGAPEVLVVAVARMGADHHAAPHRCGEGVADALGTAGVKAAGHVRAGDDLEHGPVVPYDAVGRALAEVRVQVDGCHPAPLPAWSISTMPDIRLACPGGRGAMRGGRRGQTAGADPRTTSSVGRIVSGAG